VALHRTLRQDRGVKRRLYVLLNRGFNRVLRALGRTTFQGGTLLYLTTTGRKSGRPRTVPLVYVRDGDDFVVAASNGGADWEPAWWLNVRADPRGTVEVDGTHVSVTASEVDGPGRDELWRRLNDQIDTYDRYQHKVRRQIAVVRLRPIDSVVDAP
jgi:F420H(2)-dependent quinone reductase